jgi:hypothetical protein
MVTMAKHPKSPSGSMGRLSYRPASDEGPVPKILEFIRIQLPAWRDDPKRSPDASEKLLNSSLCDFLDSRARSGFPMVRFKHEAPQAESRTVDIGVHGAEEATFIRAQSYTIYQPFMVIECKRVPAPSPKEREREYVTGKHKSSGTPAGGIQRFKLGLHGSNIETAAIVGYIEKHSLRYWHGVINGWIAELAAAETGTDGCVWSHADAIEQLVCNDEHGSSTAISSHKRTDECITPSIRLHHLWIVMNLASPE